MAKRRQEFDKNLFQTPTGVANFLHVFEPGEYKKYEVTLAFPKEDPLTDLRAAVDASVEAWKEANGELPDDFHFPIKDGDEHSNAAFAGFNIIRLKSSYQPGVVDRRGDELTDPDAIWSGCHVRALGAAQAYSTPDSCGVTVYLNSIQKVAEGRKLSGATFDAIDDDVVARLEGQMESDLADLM